MPVRKIPKNYLGVTGRYSSPKNAEMNGFESLLERDYMFHLDFDETVASFDEQPVRIQVAGVNNGYVPDVLVRYLPAKDTGEVRRPKLVEVKPTELLEKHADKFAPKFAAAEAFAAEQGWDFYKVTEQDIRTPRLKNYKFLREYRNIKPDEADLARIVSFVHDHGGTASTRNILNELAPTDEELLRWWPIVWHAILMKRVLCDWDTPFTDDVMLQLPEAVS